jgi:hypothetical protein
MSDVSFHDEIAGPSPRPVTSNRPFSISPVLEHAKGPTVPERRIVPNRRIETNPPCAFEITNYDALHGAFRARADQLEISRLTVDEIAGTQFGYAGKALGDAKVRGITLRNIEGFLGALCLKLVAVWIDQDFAFIPLDAAKVLRAASRGNATLRNLGETLAKLRIKLVAIQDDAAFERVKSRLIRRSSVNVRKADPNHQLRYERKCFVKFPVPTPHVYPAGPRHEHP